ncbi:MAG: capsular biosynthesis protein [Lachnospiraceae bacterium]|nr:capsular biosynthesis protein [Lachnospiraceae bacterium]
MIDIHCHLLYGADDGARTIEESREMLRDAREQGVTDIVCTPHYRYGMFPYRVDDIIYSFAALQEEAEQIGVNVYLGCEYHADAAMVYHFRCGACKTLADSDYVLTEYGHAVTQEQVRKNLQELIAAGYQPIIAHAERCEIFAGDFDALSEFRQMGAMVQINANSVIGKDGVRYKKVSRQILKRDLADIVASDSHNMKNRKSHMKQAHDYIADTYGPDRVWKLFMTNPGKVLE